MSLSQEALQKLYGEIQTQALKTQQELALGRSQLTAKQREMRKIQLTLSEMSSLDPDTPVYEGVGKMFVSAPVPEMKEKLQSQMKQLETDVVGLNKKLHYLETTATKSQDHIEAILKRGLARECDQLLLSAHREISRFPDVVPHEAAVEDPHPRGDGHVDTPRSAGQV